MREVLAAMVELASAMAQLRSLSPEERTEWRKFERTVSAMLDREVNPRPPRPQPPGPGRP